MTSLMAHKVTERMWVSTDDKSPYLSLTKNVKLFNGEKMSFLEIMNGYHSIS